MPMVIDRVTTATTPGETIDCVVTEMGIAVPPRRDARRDKLLAAGLPVKNIQDLKAEIERITGKPSGPALSDHVVGVVE